MKPEPTKAGEIITTAFFLVIIAGLALPWFALMAAWAYNIFTGMTGW